MSTTDDGQEGDPLLSGLIRRDYKTIEAIYDSCFPGLLKYILRNNGNREDAEDVFQESLVAVFGQAKKGLKLKSSFQAYLFSVGKFIWLKKLKNRRHTTKISLLDNNLFAQQSLEAVLEEREQSLLFQEKIRRLGNDCQEVLDLFFKGKSMEEIAEAMGYASAGYAKKRKFKCKKLLIDLIRSDPRYRELKSE